MRRGVAGVRLCDRSACAERWPCAVHGSASVGDYEHLGRHAGQFALTGRPHDDGDCVLDMVWCGRCRYALCVCLLEPAWRDPSLPDGWTRTDGDDAFSYRGGVARIEYRSHIDTWFVWCAALSTCPIRYGKTREFAMAEAERLAIA